MARRSREHEVWIALNGAFSESIESLRSRFEGFVPAEQIVVWDVPTPVAEIEPSNEWRRKTAEILREAFLESLNPDAVHISSLFEGFGDNSVVSAGTSTDSSATAVTLYDLIPLLHRERFSFSPIQDAWYQRKLANLKRADLWLAISESSRREGIEHLSLPPDQVFNISASAHSRFKPREFAPAQVEALLLKYRIDRPFILYTGATDPHKNLTGLLKAYSKLDPAVRSAHQLLAVCPAQDRDIAPLMQQAKSLGIGESDIVFAQFVPDDDLVALYNLCAVFCLPSFHEGFGLPALEAMQCGAATIGSNAASIPEVIGRADALFNPHDVQDIALHLNRVLTEPSFRNELQGHGLEQARKFSWDESARRAWDAFEARYDFRPRRTRRLPTVTAGAIGNRQLRLAWVTSAPPSGPRLLRLKRSLFQALARYYSIEIITNEPADAALDAANYPVHDYRWFEQNSLSFDRIVYAVGGSGIDPTVLHLLERHPGFVILEDDIAFDTLGMISNDELGSFALEQLYRLYGYQPLQLIARGARTSEVLRRFPLSLLAAQHALGVLVPSQALIRQAQDRYGCGLAENWVVIPPAPTELRATSRADARRELGLSQNDFVICAFIAPRAGKASYELLGGWLASDEALADRNRLTLITTDSDSEEALQSLVASSPHNASIRVARTPTAAARTLWLSAADAAIQFGGIAAADASELTIDCLATGVPTISHLQPPFEIPAGVVIPLEPDATDRELNAVLRRIRTEPGLREQLSTANTADLYRDAFERFAKHGRGALKTKTISTLVTIEPSDQPEHAWLSLARSLNRNLPVPQIQHQLLVDISELVQRDARTGVQRVTRSILQELLRNPPSGLRVEPVYATHNGPGYYYAREYTRRLLDLPPFHIDEDPVEVMKGDIFFGLDLQHHVVLSQSNFYAESRRLGAKVYFLVHDLLPVLLPHTFEPAMSEIHRRWLSALAESADGVICVSRTVADELRRWLDTYGPTRQSPLHIGWSHHGADIENSLPTRGLPQDAPDVLSALGTLPTFLIVGTVEPRKGHTQALAAFDRLWEAGHNINLVVVGKAGWKVEALTMLLRSHPEGGKRLHWLEGISDEYLEAIYAVSDCLIAPSYGEGFGLPLIEAARHHIPIIARSLPVFREVAGEHAFYFNGTEPEALADAILTWLNLHQAQQHPRSDSMPWINWNESTERLKTILLGNEWYATWQSVPSAKATA
jgi:glycosyltransferase involved in cell wall biosynthesis